MGFLDAIFDPGADERRRAGDVMQELQGRIPTLDQLRLQLEPYTVQGELRPEEIRAQLLGPSAYQSIESDPRVRGSQIGSLAELERIFNAGGLDARAKAGLEDALTQQRTASRGQQGAIMANTRARGIAGSDMETTARMLAQSDAATQGSRAALDQAALGQLRRDNSLAQASTLAGQIRGQDWTEASGRAAGQDAFSKFNALAAQDAETRNVQARNTAQAANLTNRQNTADANVDTRNTQQRYNSQLPLQIYGLQRGIAQDRVGQYDAEAAAESARNQRMAKTAMSLSSLGYGALGGLGGAAVAGAGNATANNTAQAMQQRNPGTPNSTLDLMWLDEIGGRPRATYGY